jgi:hypothetical protein
LRTAKKWQYDCDSAIGNLPNRKIMLLISKEKSEKRAKLSQAKYELTIFLDKLEREQDFTYGEMFELLSDQLRDYAKSLMRSEEDEREAASEA